MSASRRRGAAGAAARRALGELAAEHGVLRAYRDALGKRRTASEAALVAVLRALGAPLEDAGDAPAALAAWRAERAARRVEPVAVAWDGSGGAVELTVPPSGGQRRRTVDAHLALEGGGGGRWRRAFERLDDLGASPHATAGGVPWRRLRLPLPADLPAGYHTLTLDLGGGEVRETRVIAAPRRAWAAPAEGAGPATGDARTGLPWGVFLPLYALRREADDLGVGDFSDLEAMGRWVAELGGGTVATLPLLAAFLGAEGPFDPSPYAPASRLFWNELYLDLRRLPELERSAAARSLLAAAGGAAAPVGAARVDYRRVYGAKRRVLEALAASFFAGASEQRRGAFDELLHRRPELADYAAFRAVGERCGTPWREWPEAARAGDLSAAEGDEEARRVHLYAQFACEEQLAAVAASLAAAAADGGLYLDLPLGAHRDSYDTWREGDLFAEGVSAGAPPDDFFTRGQDWGFQPIHPERSRLQGHRHFAAVVRHHLRHARWLRLDHVMQLHRLFWVPAGAPATEGVYVRSPDEELYAVLTLESHRAHARLLGENLGTVPGYVDRALERHGVLRLFVLPFEIDRAEPPQALHRPVPADAVGAVDTHDMPPFRAFWEGADLDLREELGLLAPEAAAAARRDRAAERAHWRAGLRAGGRLGSGEEGPLAVHAAALASLGAGAAALVLANLEDLWGETAPQNVPGTGAERPNWRRRAALSLEEMARDPRVTAALAGLAAARRTAAGAELAWKKSIAAAGPAARPGAPAGAAPAIDDGRSRMTKDKPAQSKPAPATPAAAVADVEPVAVEESRIGDDDVYLFNEGRHFRLYDKLGAHRARSGGQEGYAFAVWAPDAERVSVIGDFNGWDRDAHPLSARGSSGIWEGFLPGIEAGSNYKFHVASRFGGYRVDKADPFAVRSEVPPKTGSVLWHLDYEWGDGAWMAGRGERSALDRPVSIYEMHLGSWRRVPEEENRPLTYRELAEPLAEHLESMGFTHVEFLPLMEHPFYGSWGYQTTGYFAPTARYGTPQDLMFLIDHLHQRGFGVILDWVPSHFPTDEHGLAYFDGTHLFEHSDPRVGFHPDWNSYIFNYGRHEVRSFLISSALYWLDRFHADGLRVDAVASMLYRDYSRQPGEWIPNVHGGRENLEAIDFLRQLNTAVYEHHPDVQTFAEESTSWPMVSRPTYVGGLGFGYKWDMGWMHDTLVYMSKEPVHRKFHQGQLTFRMIYAFSESFILPLSHDEVVHGKGSLLGKMPGDDWQKFANLRLLYGYMWLQPGKKLLFMGSELGQWDEWSHESSVAWHLGDHGPHQGIARLVGDLNRLYRGAPALHQLDCDPAGFEWIDASDAESSVLSFLRRGRDGDERFVAVFNFTPVPRHAYRIGVPGGGRWAEVLNTDSADYGGSGQGNLGGVDASPTPLHGRSHSVALTLPPLGMVLLRNGG